MSSCKILIDYVHGKHRIEYACSDMKCTLRIPKGMTSATATEIGTKFLIREYFDHGCDGIIISYVSAPNGFGYNGYYVHQEESIDNAKVRIDWTMDNAGRLAYTWLNFAKDLARLEKHDKEVSQN